MFRTRLSEKSNLRIPGPQCGAMQKPEVQGYERRRPREEEVQPSKRIRPGRDGQGQNKTKDIDRNEGAMATEVRWWLQAVITLIGPAETPERLGTGQAI
jgi:hypothetical protein